jgi:hypothetical protein
MSSIGRKGGLGIGIEGTPGTTTEIKTFCPFLDLSLAEAHTPIGDKSAKGVREEFGKNPVEGKKWGEGSVEVILDPETAPAWFSLALGAISSATDALTVHSIYRNNSNQPLSATIYRSRDVDEVKFPYSVVNSLELSFADDVAKIKCDIMSKYPVAEGDTPSYDDLELYTFKNAYLELTNGGATSELKVRELTLNIENNIEPIYAPNSNDVDRYVSKNFNVNGSFTVLFEDETQKDAFKDLTNQALSIVFTGNAGGETGKITITIPQFRVDKWTAETPIDDLSQETVDFVAEYDGTTTGCITVEVKNQTYSY